MRTRLTFPKAGRRYSATISAYRSMVLGATWGLMWASHFSRKLATVSRDGSTAALQFCEQPSNLYLRLALRASEAMPAPLASPSLRITHVDDDGPMAGGTLADMALHSSLHQLRANRANASVCRSISLSNFSFIAVSFTPNDSVIPNCASLSFSSLKA